MHQQKYIRISVRLRPITSLYHERFIDSNIFHLSKSDMYTAPLPLTPVQKNKNSLPTLRHFISMKQYLYFSSFFLSLNSAHMPYISFTGIKIFIYQAYNELVRRINDETCSTHQQESTANCIFTLKLRRQRKFSQAKFNFFAELKPSTTVDDSLY